MSAEMIKIVMLKRKETQKGLAAKLGTSQGNLWNKFNRDNFSINELKEIAGALDCELVLGFKMKDTGEIING